MTTSKIKRLSAFAALAALTLGACGSDDDTSESTDTTAPADEGTDEGTDDAASTTAPADEGTDNGSDTTEAPDATTAGTASADAIAASGLDSNDDGDILFGIATPGPRDDGGYYQALVEGVSAFASAQGFSEPIIVDNIDPAQAETEMRNLARQGVDVIAVGAGEISDPLETLPTEFADIYWYCNCGAGTQFEGVAQSSDDSSQISYSAGYATGLLLADTDKTNATFLGCCDLDFEKEAFNAWTLGVQAVNPDFTTTYIPTGDFNDVAGATEAFNQAVAAGAGAVYPFLGGASEAISGLSNEQGVITMSAGASDVCERTDLDYQIAVQFDGGDYLEVIFDKILNGELKEGETFLFQVGDFPFVGAKFCDATPEQVAALDEVSAQIANGDFADQFYQIKADAYGF